MDQLHYVPPTDELQSEGLVRKPRNKRIESFLGIFQFAMVGLIAAPVGRFPVLRYLPLAEGNRLIRRVMAEELSIFELPATDLLFLFANSALYFGLGFLAFKLLENVARDRGLLGHY